MPLGHLRSRDGIDLCPSSVANPSRHRSRAYQLARCFAGRWPNCHRTATQGRQSPVCARTLSFMQFIWHGNRHSTGLQGIFARAMAPICVHRAPRTPPDIAPGHIGSRDDLFMSGAPQRQQLASERTPLTLFAPAPSTVSCVPLTRNLSPEECSRRSEEKYYSIDSRYQTPTVLDFEKVFVYL